MRNLQRKQEKKKQKKKKTHPIIMAPNAYTTTARQHPAHQHASPTLLTDRTPSARSSTAVSVHTATTSSSSSAAAAAPWSNQSSYQYHQHHHQQQQPSLSSSHQHHRTSNNLMEEGIRGCCGQQDGDLVPPWMEWIESGIEFFGCDENSPGGGKSVFGRTVLLRHVPAHHNDDNNTTTVGGGGGGPNHSTTMKDYAQLHDDFIESLLHEQVKLSMAKSPQQQQAHQPLHKVEEDGGGVDGCNGCSSDIPDLETVGSEDSSNFSGISTDSFSTTGAHSLNSMKTSRRGRMMRLHNQRGPPPPPTTTTSNSSIGTNTSSSTTTRKKQQSSPLRRTTTTGSSSSRRARVAPIEAYTKKYQPKKMQEELSFTDLAAGNHPKPITMMHPDCKLQKDKGKGEPLGSSISATGRELCLDKLRQKMELLMQVALGEDRRGPTGMKRRSAKVSEERVNYIETRSMIELRLGFLTMQYGVLIQWDTQRTGKILFIVLRKMCHDSFYTKLVVNRSFDNKHGTGGGGGPNGHHHPLHPSTATTIMRRQLEAPPLVIRNLNGNHAIYQRPNGTEVVFVDPPYRIPQPDVFAPAILSVEINHAVGLSKKSKWTLSLTFDKNAEEMQLLYNADKHQWEPRRGNTTIDGTHINIMQWEMADVTSFDLAGLEIRLFEQRKTVRGVASVLGPNKLAATMTMPLGGLVAQPSTSHATSWQVTIPCSHDHKASVTFSFSHQSDYAHWLYKELDARRREEVSGFVWKAPFRRVVKEIKGHDYDPETYDDDGNDDFMEWFCGFCFGDE